MNFLSRVLRKKETSPELGIKADHMQPLVILREKPELETLYKAILKSQDETKKRIEELELMAKRIGEVHTETAEKLWKSLTEKAQELGVIPEGVIIDKTHKIGVRAGTLVIQSVDSVCNCIGCQIARMT